MQIEDSVRDACARARSASRSLASLSRDEKDAALTAIAEHIMGEAATIVAANAADVAAARARGTKESLIDRLMLDATRVKAIADGVRAIAALRDPIGEIIEQYTRSNGLEISRVRVPIGVIAMIYEARPNVTVEASALTLKSGNAVVLRGGSDALRSNLAFAGAIARALSSAGIAEGAVEILTDGSRESVRALIDTPGRVDLAIPRGGESLIREVAQHARVPLVLHYKGVCHLYLDRGADVAVAARIACDAKLARPGVCNALECLLIDRADAARVLPAVAAALLAGGCELRGCPESCALVSEASAASEDDYGFEFLDRVLAVKVVDGLSGAMEHIARYGSQHTEAIVTPSSENALRFSREVDAACVVVNASTRFHDGGELGLGAEIGIATSRLHWRGPMGLEALTTMKWVVRGAGQVREATR